MELDQQTKVRLKGLEKITGQNQKQLIKKAVKQLAQKQGDQLIQVQAQQQQQQQEANLNHQTEEIQSKEPDPEQEE